LPGKALAMQIALPEPTALVAFETQRVLVAPSRGELKPLELEEGQWADNVPRLVQTKMAESFENAGFAHVGKAMDGFTPEVQLLLEIRSFDISLVAPSSARIEISAKSLGADGRISAERRFSATAPATGGDTTVQASPLPADRLRDQERGSYLPRRSRAGLVRGSFGEKAQRRQKMTTPPSPEIIARVRAEARGLIALTIKEVSNGAWRQAAGRGT
jgi:ABC-type transport auxiliary lipoprotein component